MTRISSNRRKAILREVRKLQRTLYETREELWGGSPPSDPVDLIDLRIIITKLLRVRYSEPEEIPPQSGHSHIAGYIDRDAKEIAVAQRLKPEIRRFTAAHEIGHWVLHPGTTYFRDAPVDGNDRDQARPIEEREADLFASALLMPVKLVRKEFRRHFGEDSLAAAPIDQYMAALLTHGQSRRSKPLKPSELVTTRQISTLASKCLSLWSPGYPSLAELFKVSPAAMAICLEELRLVPQIDEPAAIKPLKISVWRYDVFISYAREDKNLVQPIIAQLRSRGLNPWSDDSLLAGETFIHRIEDAMRNSATAAVFLGAKRLTEFQYKEVAFLDSLKRTLIPVLLPGWKGEMPLLIADRQAVDLRENDPNALEKLLQGIINGAKGKNSN